MSDILLVEDKDSLQRVLRLTVETAGYTVTEAADALQAYDNNKTRAAESLGVSYKTLLTKIKDYNL